MLKDLPQTFKATLITTSIFSIIIAGCKKDTVMKSGDTTGSVMFWQQTDQGQITVSCGGQTQTIASYYSGGAPSGCGAQGCATFDLAPGTYSFSANNATGSTWNGNVTVTANGCFKDQLTGGTNTGGGGSEGGGNNTGQVMFWQQTDQGQITVSCGGQTQTITSYYSGGAPSGCGAQGCATFSLSPGTYSFSASNTAGSTWNGNVTVTANGCFKDQLSGGSNSGGGGGGGNTGQVMFWIKSDFGCGNITVKCGGVSEVITSYYSAGAPDCGANGAATFNLSPGNYSFSASCSSYTWNGTVTVTANGCFKEQLTQ